MKKFLFIAILMAAVGCSKKEESAAPSDTSKSASIPTGQSSLPNGVPNGNGTVPSTPPYTPTQTVEKISDALKSGDTGTYLKLVSYSKWQNYQRSPKMLMSTFAFWSVQKPDLHVISQEVEGANARVVYRLTIAGSQPVNTVDSSDFVLENGMWKYDR